MSILSWLVSCLWRVLFDNRCGKTPSHCGHHILHLASSKVHKNVEKTNQIGQKQAVGTDTPIFFAFDCGYDVTYQQPQTVIFIVNWISTLSLKLIFFQSILSQQQMRKWSRGLNPRGSFQEISETNVSLRCPPIDILWNDYFTCINEADFPNIVSNDITMSSYKQILFYNN